MTDHYKSVIEKSPIGYAYHKIICDEAGNPCDYVFIEVNAAFERFTGLKSEAVIGRRITEVMPGIQEGRFDWIRVYGEIAIHGEKREIEQYSEILQKWFRVYTYSPEKGYFITWVTDISKEKKELEEKTIILTSMNDIIFELDELYTFKNIIVADEEYLFIPRQAVIGRRIDELFSEELSGRFLAAFKKTTVSGQKEKVMYKSPIPGDDRWFEAEIFFWNTGTSEIRYIVSIREITEQKKVEDALLNKTEELEKFFDVNLDLLCIADMHGNFIKVNNAWEKILGYPAAELEKRKFLEFVHPEDMEATLDSVTKLSNNEQILNFVNRYKCIDGSYRYIEWCSQPYGDKIYAAARDITDRKLAEERILYLSFNDQLTGLYNRRFYEEELKRLDTERNLPLSLIMADVNGLKLTNDAFGHLVGDKLLKKAAEVIKNECRSDEIVSRIGGDEFVIILPKTDAYGAESLVKRIRESIAREKADLLDLSVSLGWAIKKHPGENVEDTFKKAEDNMYQQKVFESPKMKEKAIRTILSKMYERLPEEKKHSERVSKICGLIGRELGFSKRDAEEIKTAGLMHDIGKIILSEEILQKPEKLSDSEWIEIKRHTETGYLILGSLNDMAQIAKYTLHHHERWDGSGYPNGLRGEEIPLQSRIIGIADAYDAMLSNRPYRKSLSKEEIIKEFKEHSGTQFDPEIARVFVENILEKL